MNYTVILPYYNNHAQLLLWLEEFRGYDDRWKMIVVDDGSTIPLQPYLSWNDRVRLYRVKEDKPWNQHGARNLGAHVADYGWLFMTDIDHIMSARDANSLLESKLDPAKYYMFNRRNIVTKEAKDPHPNTFLLQRSVFWKSGGYDEDFCGTYGGDRQFQNLLNYVATHEHNPIIVLDYYPRSDFPEAGTQTLGRKESEYHEKYKVILNQKKMSGQMKPDTHLRFAWERVC